MAQNPQISVVIPLYNEEETLPTLLERLSAAAKDWGEYEVILVNDGSKDRTWEILKEAPKQNPNFKVVNFSRNFGHQAAMSAGLERSRGAAVVMMDGDLQDPPELIKDMMAIWQDGTKIVYAVRQNRKEGWFKKFCYSMYYKLLRYMAEVEVPLDSGDFCLMDRQVVDALNALPERNKFFRGLRMWSGYSKKPFHYDRDARFAGETKYPFMRLVKFGLAGMVAMSNKPLKVATYLGVAIALTSFLAGIVLIILRLTVGIDLSGWTSLILSIYFMGGLQLLVLGVVGEYLGILYNEAKGRPLYLVNEEIGF